MSSGRNLPRRQASGLGSSLRRVGRFRLRIRPEWGNVKSWMKQLFKLSVMALVLAAFATTTFAGNCGSCPGEGSDKAKDKDKAEEGSAG